MSFRRHYLEIKWLIDATNFDIIHPYPWCIELQERHHNIFARTLNRQLDAFRYHLVIKDFRKAALLSWRPGPDVLGRRFESLQLFLKRWECKPLMQNDPDQLNCKFIPHSRKLWSTSSVRPSDRRWQTCNAFRRLILLAISLMHKPGISMHASLSHLSDRYVATSGMWFRQHNILRNICFIFNLFALYEII